jgi:L-alanine-DL-glutamate epimerase-like enolase superfamily enzyme
VDGLLAMEFPQYVNPLATEPLESIWNFNDGYLTPPHEPGLGVKISDDLLRTYEYTSDSERDY